ncbi:MAG: hypothetical protein IPM60_15500 [Rhodospirillales bacterium]|nr:hypothetical protein [Rhodospirillales bacterium]
MADTGWQSCATGTNDDRFGTLAWGFPERIVALDGSRSHIVSQSGTSNYLKATNFGSAIPAGATIDGVEIWVEARRASGTPTFPFDRVRLVDENDVVGDTDRASGTVVTDAGYDPYYFGGPSDLWGEALTPAILNNSASGVVVATSLAEVYYPQIDYIARKVYYSTSTTHDAAASAAGAAGVGATVDLVRSATASAAGVGSVAADASLICSTSAGVAAAAAAAAQVIGIRRVSAATAAAATAGGAATALRDMAGAASGEASFAGTPMVLRPATGNAVGGVTASASAINVRAVAGGVACAALVSGTTTAAGEHDATAAAVGAASATGAVEHVRFASATVSGLGVPQGIPTAVRNTAASVAGSAGTTARIGGDWLAIGTAAGMAVVVGLAIGGYGASKAERILRALKARLETIDAVRVERNTALPERIPAGGLIVLRDGDPGEPDVALGGFAGAYYSHTVDVEVYVAEGDDAARDTAFDALLQALDDALIADPTLGGLAFGMEYGRPAVDVEPVEGAAAIKSATLPIVVEYETATRLG